MDEQLKAVLEGINALKNSQKETKNELKERMEKGLENVQKSQEETKKGLESEQKSQDETKKSGKCTEEPRDQESLANLAFSDHPATVREAISLQYFVDDLKDGEIQKAVRMADEQDLKSALLYALKLEAATQASRRDRQTIRGARVTADEPCESRLLKEMEKLKEEMKTIKAGISNQAKRNFKCWGCGGTGHLKRNCPRARKEENTVSSKQEN
ncbi:uncharacterized protein TNCV_4344621 [Trichonephila clavipes]|nr:uncharacterized protein TNCV_4344621 [Trichonephila clavipes]